MKRKPVLTIVQYYTYSYNYKERWVMANAIGYYYGMQRMLRNGKEWEGMMRNVKE